MPYQLSDLHALLLQHVLKRIDLTPEEQQHFCALTNVRSLLPRQYLLQQGDICRHESFVCTGFLRSFFLDKQGTDHTLHFAMEDWWITDSSSFLRQTPTERNIVTLEPTLLLQISYADLEQLYRDIPALERFWRLMHQNACLAQDQRILQNISMTGVERYEALILKYPTLEQRLPQKHIASYLGVTPVFLSKIRKQYSG